MPPLDRVADFTQTSNYSRPLLFKKKSLIILHVQPASSLHDHCVPSHHQNVVIKIGAPFAVHSEDNLCLPYIGWQTSPRPGGMAEHHKETPAYAGRCYLYPGNKLYSLHI